MVQGRQGHDMVCLGCKNKGYTGIIVLYKY